MPDIEGFEIILGGKTYTVPPLTLKALKKILPLMKDFGALSFDQQIDAALTVIQEALARNYPEITIDKMEEDLGWPDFERIALCLPQLMQQSGLKFMEAVPGESQGESRNPSIGDLSTAISQQAPDGSGEKLTT